MCMNLDRIQPQKNKERGTFQLNLIERKRGRGWQAGGSWIISDKSSSNYSFYRVHFERAASALQQTQSHVFCFLFFLTQRDRHCDVFCCSAAAPSVSGVLPVIKKKERKKSLLQFGNTIRQPNRTPNQFWLTNVLRKKKKRKKNLVNKNKLGSILHVGGQVMPVTRGRGRGRGVWVRHTFLSQTQPSTLLFYTCGIHRAWLVMGLPHIDYHLRGATCTLQFQRLVQC